MPCGPVTALHKGTTRNASADVPSPASTSSLSSYAAAVDSLSSAIRLTADTVPLGVVLWMINAILFCKEKNMRKPDKRYLHCGA
jgi:hypothetical protein